MQAVSVLFWLGLLVTQSFATEIQTSYRAMRESLFGGELFFKCAQYEFRLSSGIFGYSASWLREGSWGSLSVSRTEDAFVEIEGLYLSIGEPYLEPSLKYQMKNNLMKTNMIQLFGNADEYYFDDSKIVAITMIFDFYTQKATFKTAKDELFDWRRDAALMIPLPVPLEGGTKIGAPSTCRASS